MKRWNSTNIPIFLLFCTAFLLFGGIQSAAIGLENTPNRVETGYTGREKTIIYQHISLILGISITNVNKMETSKTMENYFCHFLSIKPNISQSNVNQGCQVSLLLRSVFLISVFVIQN